VCGMLTCSGIMRAAGCCLEFAALSARVVLPLDACTLSRHSLRSGFLQIAVARGASLFEMMDVSCHKSGDTLRGYVRDADAFRDHAEAGLL